MRISIAALAISAGLVGPAIATDLYSNGAAPSALQSVAGTVASGAYVSVGAGASLASAHVPQAESDFSLAGPVGDIRLGWDYKIPNAPWLIGVLAGVSFEEATGNAQGNKIEQVIGYEGGLRAGRALNGSSLIYGLIAYRGKHIGIIDTNFSTDLQGLETGLGVEIELRNGVTLGGEVDYTIYRDWRFGGSDGVTIGENELMAMARLGFKPAAIIPALN
jgi:opacity protein-like surface antigen